MPEDILGAIGNLAGAGIKYMSARDDRKSSEATAMQNIALQKQFAKNGIQWKVEDALKAGVHPLFALGASTQSFSPVSVASGLSEGASGFASAGQDIGRAVNATFSKEDRTSAAGKAAQALTLEKGQLENDLLRTQLASQVAKLTQAGGNPAMPTASGGRKNKTGQPALDMSEVPQDTKHKARPPLLMGGSEIQTHPQTSNMEAYEDRIGDEGPGNWLAQAGVMWNDLKHNINTGNLTRESFLSMLGNNLKWVDRNTSLHGIGKAANYVRGGGRW